MKIRVNQSKGRALIIAAILLAQSQTAFTQSVDQSIDSGTIAPSPSDSGSALNFQADIFTGRFSYAVHIKVPPGRQGSEPKLNLGYNSAGGSGWCGVGWALETGYIQRDTRKGVPISWQSYEIIGHMLPFTNYLNHTIPSSQYDDSKGFIANFGGTGSALVQIGPTNQNPIVYRQQVDTTFLTYNYYTNDNHWEIVDKGGNIFYFGEGLTNQMVNNKPGWATNSGQSTFRWALDRVVDVNGNETFLRYTTDNGALYLTNITYNANMNSPALAATHEVDFILTNRPDTNISFLSGYRVQMQKRLSEIDVKVSGANVHKYVLGYTQSSSSPRSLLSSVTEYGSDFTTALPPTTFNYQVKPPAFGPDTQWNSLNSQGNQSSAALNSVRAVDGNGASQALLADIDGDGLPDRVMRDFNSPFTTFFVQRNTGTCFSNINYTWSPMDSQGETDSQWNSVVANNGTTYVDFLDINGDGFPDRVMRSDFNNHTNFLVQFNTGIQGNKGFTSATSFGRVTNIEVSAANDQWLAPEYKTVVALIDINGDGLPDRVSRKVNSPYDSFYIQLNTGNGFTTANYSWRWLDSQGQTGSGWNGVSAVDGNGNQYVILMDINGDGLPDRIMRSVSAPFDHWVVQFNNGAGFEPAENWGTVDNQGHTSSGAWGSPIGSDGANVWATLVDINGDGLPDRVMRNDSSPYTTWLVQLNTGSGFAPSISWGPVDGQGYPTSDKWGDISARSSGDTYVDFLDINGDGLPDRVMRQHDPDPAFWFTPAGYYRFIVQLNQGPFPDLLNVVSNGMGGSIKLSYIATTTLDNRNTNWVTDPWVEGAKSLLPFNSWVVNQISVSDGLGNVSTNTYAFKGGYFNTTDREFRGFSQVAVTDPLGTKTVTYYHQSGGRDNTVLGEYLDQSSKSKKGTPFRTEVIGSDGKTNSITLNKVEEVMLNSNGWYFPFISQSIVMNFEGLSSYRATAKQFLYDTNTGNVFKIIQLGEVANVVVQGQTFTDVGSDSIYTWMTYGSSGAFSDKPTDIKITSDNLGNNKLRETKLAYNERGNLTTNTVWLNTTDAYITTTSIGYDQYGNPIWTTDAAGITKETSYDPTYHQFPVTQATATFTNQFIYDARSGLEMQGTDAKGLVISNAFDVFFRSVAVYLSTTPYGAPTLWRSKTSYLLGGILNGVSYNCVHNQVNDAVDTANGFETYVYFDGTGRTIQTRSEAENGQFRVANTLFDRRGNAYYQTLPYFSPGSGNTVLNATYSGTITEYDNIGRAFRITPAVQSVFNSSGLMQSLTPTAGDSGSPEGQTTTAFMDGNNPWAIIVTDSEGKIKKSYRDAFGQSLTIIEVTTNGNYSTTYAYNLLGNLTNVTDSAGNTTRMIYDSMGRKISMIDPDMGAWNYGYDDASRLVHQTDARGNQLKMYYNDPIGRMTSKEIYNSDSHIVGTVTYTYDSSDDPNYTVYKGQLYKVTDLQGYQRNSYDVRGRVLKSTRFLSLNAIEYVTQTAYDDANRVQQLIYPGNSATIQYSYDTAGNLSQVKSLTGTGTPEVFYAPLGFNELGQLLGYTNGNGVRTTNIYYANSKRPQRVWVSKGTNNFQDLSYTYDTVSNLKSVSDGVYTGMASASIGSITYDDLYRPTSLNSTARGTKTYGYNSIGNILTNQDFGLGSYQYGSRPHAVTSANGINYSYDACGNMTMRGSQTLTYDEQNELVRVSSAGTNVLYGYADGGERVWRCGTNGYSIWVGGIYEINNGKILCHVMAGGKRIATFEPQCNAGLAKVFGEQRWYLASGTIQSALNWPFQKGRSGTTLFTAMWAGILGLCLIAGRRVSLKRHEWKQVWRLPSLWKQAIAVVSISAFLAASIENVEAATYNPVFYYYYSDNLGSSNVLVDRTGVLVQHYEYGTFGQTSYTDNTSAFPVSNRYTGQMFDDETGLYYYGARYYDPQLGRFTQPDTVVPGVISSQNLNRYSYVNNNPLNHADPSGHSWLSSGLKLAWKILVATVATFTNPKTWESIGESAAMGALIGLCTGGGWGALIGAIIGAAVAIIGAEIVTIATVLGGPKAGQIAGLVYSIAVAVVGCCYGVGMIGTNNTMAWTYIASSCLSIGSATSGYVGDESLSEGFGYASMATAIMGAAVFKLEQGAKPTGNYDEIDVKGVGARGKNDIVPGKGEFNDAMCAAAERLGISADDLNNAVTEWKSRIEYNNEGGVETFFRGHSQGCLLIKMALGRLNAMGVDLSQTYVELDAGPITKVEFVGKINLSHITVNNQFWDPVHNTFGAPYNPFQTAVGLLSFPFTVGFHSSVNYYGFSP